MATSTTAYDTLKVGTLDGDVTVKGNVSVVDGITGNYSASGGVITTVIVFTSGLDNLVTVTHKEDSTTSDRPEIHYSSYDINTGESIDKLIINCNTTDTTFPVLCVPGFDSQTNGEERLGYVRYTTNGYYVPESNDNFSSSVIEAIECREVTLSRLNARSLSISSIYCPPSVTPTNISGLESGSFYQESYYFENIKTGDTILSVSIETGKAYYIIVEGVLSNVTPSKSGFDIKYIVTTTDIIDGTTSSLVKREYSNGTFLLKFEDDNMSIATSVRILVV